jgi:hypothetical protein
VQAEKRLSLAVVRVDGRRDKPYYIQQVIQINLEEG